jgi:hypothetical protein
MLGLVEWFTFTQRAEFYVATAAQLSLLCCLCFRRLSAAVERKLPESQKVGAPREYSLSQWRSCTSRLVRTSGARVASWLWLPAAFASTMTALSWLNAAQILLLSLTLPVSRHSSLRRRLTVTALARYFVLLMNISDFFIKFYHLINFSRMTFNRKTFV